MTKSYHFATKYYEKSVFFHATPINFLFELSREKDGGFFGGRMKKDGLLHNM